MVTDMTCGEMVTETGIGIGTETEAGRGIAGTGIEATAGSGGGMIKGQTGMAATEEVRQRLILRFYGVQAQPTLRGVRTLCTIPVHLDRASDVCG